MRLWKVKRQRVRRPVGDDQVLAAGFATSFPFLVLHLRSIRQFYQRCRNFPVLRQELAERFRCIRDRHYSLLIQERYEFRFPEYRYESVVHPI